MPYDKKSRDIDTPSGYMRPLKREQFNMAVETQVPSATGGAPKVSSEPPLEVEQAPIKIEATPGWGSRDTLPILPRLKGPSDRWTAEDYNIANAAFIQEVSNVLRNSMDDPAVAAAVGDNDVDRFALDIVAYMQRSFEPPGEVLPLPDQVAMSRTALKVHNWLNTLRNQRAGV